MRLLRFLPRFRKAARAMAALEERESWPRAQIEALQLERVNALWANAVAHVPYYRQLRAERRLPDRFASLEEFKSSVPPLPKATIRARAKDLLSEKAGSGHWERTSGSTGIPMSAFWEYEAHREMRHFQYRFYQAWGVDVFDRSAFLWGHRAYWQPGLSGVWQRNVTRPLIDWLRNRLRLCAYGLDREELRGHLKRIRAYRPVALYGWSTAVFLLAQEALASGFGCDSLRLANMTSEVVYPHIRQTVERAFGVPAVTEYGAVECGFIAGDAPDRTLRVREDGILLETLPRPDGRYDINLTVLHNLAFPLIRYAIADVTDEPLLLPERGFAILHNVAGRNNDLMLSKTGRYVHPVRVEAMFKYAGDAIRRFRLHQQADGRVLATVELDPPDARLDTADLERQLVELLEGYPAQVQVVACMPQTGAGKHRWIMSDLVNLNQPERTAAAPLDVPDEAPAAGA
jgi:phenylacetate-CoA ligase